MFKINHVTIEALYTYTIYLVNRIKEKYSKKLAINLLL